MNKQIPPEFYTGAPVDSSDLRFRGEFLAELWETLATKHVLLTAPRRTGKTSVMDHLRDFPQANFKVISINVQDLSHPADCFQSLLDAFHDAYPNFVRDHLSAGWGLVKKALTKVENVGLSEFKLALREGEDWNKNWRENGSKFLKLARAADLPILFIIDELPDMLLNMKKKDPELLKEFLAWFRTQRLKPTPKNDPVRWLIGGSVNLTGTLDSLGMVDLINDIEDVPLPVLSENAISSFVREMLTGRGVVFTDNVPQQLIARLGRPIPLFMQMATQDLYRLWKLETRELTDADVDAVFDGLIKTSAAKSKLQHYYSRIREYYDEPKRSVAYEFLSKISVSDGAISRKALYQDLERLFGELKIDAPAHERKRRFNQLMQDLENDFYIVEIEDDRYDFASGVLKAWWRKYYA